ncbi:class B sortase [Lachnospiraceae bacterium 48-21]
MRKVKEFVFLILLIALFAVFAFAVWKLTGIYLEYQQGDEAYEDLQDYVQKSLGDENTPKKNRPEQELDEADIGYLKIDFEGLKKINPDVVAWIQIPALDISYPMVQGRDNYYYLHHLFDGLENKNGSIFVDYHNQPDFMDSNTIVYGHNMKNGSMFGTLECYQDKELYQKYPYFYIYVPGYVLEYQIISCYAGRNGSTGYTYSFPKPKDFRKFADTVLSYSAYDTGAVVTDTDKIVTLSTCVNTDRNYRYLVHGKMIKKILN